MNRFKLVLFAAMLVFALSSAAGAEGGTLVYSWSSNAGPLNPHMYSPNQMFAQAMVYEPLVRYGDDGRLQPCLAESWEISPTAGVHLPPEEGRGLLRRRAVERRRRQEEPGRHYGQRPRHAWIGLTNHLEAVEAPEEHTLVLRLNSPYYPALHDLSAIRPFRFLSPAAFPDEGITRDGIKAPVGTGPWVHADSSRGEFDLFVRNDRYWGEKPHFEKILVKVITDADARMLALETGEIDLIFGAAGSSVARLAWRAL